MYTDKVIIILFAKFAKSANKIAIIFIRVRTF